VMMLHMGLKDDLRCKVVNYLFKTYKKVVNRAQAIEKKFKDSRKFRIKKNNMDLLVVRRIGQLASDLRDCRHRGSEFQLRAHEPQFRGMQACTTSVRKATLKDRIH